MKSAHWVRPGSWPVFRASLAMLTVLAFGASAALAQEDNADMAFAKSLADCQQDHLATLALRACSSLLNAPGLPSQKRFEVLVLRGSAWLSEQEPGEAANDFTRALELEPHNAAVIEKRARAYSAMGQHSQAAADWTALATLDPANGLALQQKGLSHLAAGQFDDALGAFEKALSLDPKSVEALVGQASVYVSLNDKGKALADFGRALAIDPANIKALMAKAEAAERWGDNELAIETYLNAVKANGMLLKPRRALQRLGVDTPTPR